MPGCPASGGASATCTRPQEHCTSCRSYWVVSAFASGRSVTWWEYFTPRSRASSRLAPHPQVPSGNRGTVLSGFSFHSRYAPGAPRCFPGLRFPPPPGSGRGGFLPGWSSPLGAIEEFAEFRETSRSSRARRSRSSAFSAFSSAFSA